VAVGNSFVIALGQTLPLQMFKSIKSPGIKSPSVKSNKFRLHSANPIGGHGANRDFASLNKSMNSTNQVV